MKVIMLQIFISIYLICNSCLNQGTFEPEDKKLAEMKKLLPVNWNISILDTMLIIERKDSVWIMFENKINAEPDFNTTQTERENRIMQYGIKAKCRIIYRVEDKWSDRKISAYKANNDSIQRIINSLPEKYHLTELLSQPSKDEQYSFYDLSEEESKALALYNKEQKELEDKKKKLPNCHTDNYSLFYIGMEGTEDELHTVYPGEASTEAYQLQNKICK
ncbi:MAG: hypothetical protein HY738_01715 [Bacteroidia bacterium]|nr:hypothetical protein [Bacteroidia bacterium]